jgi:2'-5' RNA ligase
MEESLRLFIAIDLSAEVRRWLGEAKALLADRIEAGAVRWMNVGSIHITLKFLGETPARRVEEIRAVLDRLARGRAPFPIAVEGLGCFPNFVRPRVIWAGVRTGPALQELQKQLEADLERVGFPPERRPFSPHLTLGRVKDGVVGPRLAEIGRAVETASTSSAAAMDVRDWCLFRSVLRPGGSEYTVLHRAEFTTR